MAFLWSCRLRRHTPFLKWWDPRQLLCMNRVANLFVFFKLPFILSYLHEKVAILFICRHLVVNLDTSINYARIKVLRGWEIFCRLWHWPRPTFSQQLRNCRSQYLSIIFWPYFVQWKINRWVSSVRNPFTWTKYRQQNSKSSCGTPSKFYWRKKSSFFIKFFFQNCCLISKIRDVR